MSGAITLISIFPDSALLPGTSSGTFIHYSPFAHVQRIHIFNEHLWLCVFLSVCRIDFLLTLLVNPSLIRSIFVPVCSSRNLWHMLAWFELLFSSVGQMLGALGCSSPFSSGGVFYSRFPSRLVRSVVGDYFVNSHFPWLFGSLRLQ